MNYNSISGSGNCSSYPVRLTDFFIGELGSDAYERQICLVDGYELHTIGLVQVYYLMSDIYLGTEDKLFAYIYLADQRLGGNAVLQRLKKTICLKSLTNTIAVTCKSLNSSIRTVWKNSNKVRATDRQYAGT